MGLGLAFSLLLPSLHEAQPRRAAVPISESLGAVAS